MTHTLTNCAITTYFSDTWALTMGNGCTSIYTRWTTPISSFFVRSASYVLNTYIYVLGLSPPSTRFPLTELQFTLNLLCLMTLAYFLFFFLIMMIMKELTFFLLPSCQHKCLKPSGQAQTVAPPMQPNQMRCVFLYLSSITN